MLDFKEIPKSGTKLEQLTREILFLSGYSPYWTGEGPDQGRDLYFTEVLKGPLSSSARKWLVQCKHTAHSGKAVGRSDVGSIIEDCRQIGASGFLLVTTTHPSAALLMKLHELKSQNNGLDEVMVWDGVELEKRLMEPRNFSLCNLFFPKYSKKVGWKVYNRGEPNKWTAHYKGYFLVLDSRIASSHPSLEDCELIISKIEAIIPPSKDEFIRPRAVHYDDKHDNYVVYIDYMHPFQKEPSLKKNAILDLLDNGNGLHHGPGWTARLTYWDLRFQPYSPNSDHYDRDHYDYYCDHMASYEAGMMRVPFWRHRSGEIVGLK